MNTPNPLSNGPRGNVLSRVLLGALVAGWSLGTLVLADTETSAVEPPAGEPGGAGLALKARKVLTATIDGPGFVDNGIVLVRDGKIEAVGRQRDLEIPEGYEVVDAGDEWLSPGLVDLHSHVGGSRDYNDMVFQTNPGLRISTAVVPHWNLMDRALQGGVTTVLFIPGSGTNMGGQGVLLKNGFGTYEEMEIRNPGSLKIAQGDNPTRWGYGMGRSQMNFNIRTTIRKGQVYYNAWKDHLQNGGPKPERSVQLEIFRHLFAHDAQVSTHTQYYQLVLMSITLMRGEFGLDVFIDHGTFDGYRTAPLAEEMGVAAIIGPREISRDSRRYPNDIDGSIVGAAAEYQARGHSRVGFNTDAPVVPQEELHLQAAMGVRYGLANDRMGAVRGVTIVPALTAGIGDRTGSLEVGKDADILIVSGDPADPRSAVRSVYVEGRLVFHEGEVQR